MSEKTTKKLILSAILAMQSSLERQGHILVLPVLNEDTSLDELEKNYQFVRDFARSIRD